MFRKPFVIYHIIYVFIIYSILVVFHFKVNASIYKLDKPVIIGEFSQKRGGTMTSSELFTWAYYRGYSGAWSWSALGSGELLE